MRSILEQTRISHIRQAIFCQLEQTARMELQKEQPQWFESMHRKGLDSHVLKAIDLWNWCQATPLLQPHVSVPRVLEPLDPYQGLLLD